MKVINQKFIINNLTSHFVQESMNKIIEADPSIMTDKRYWLYYYVKTDYDNIVNSLFNYNIDDDPLGFPNQQKTIRHQIEAFLDLFNLCHDKKYMVVLQKNNQERVTLGKYAKFLGKGSFFNSRQKLEIAAHFGFQYSDYLEMFICNANRYVHPNVFIEPTPPIYKDKLIRNILDLSIFIMGESYKLMYINFGIRGIQPTLNCVHCNEKDMLCNRCFENTIAQDRYFVSYDPNLIQEYNIQSFEPMFHY